jgi:chemotaxis protein MotB
MAYKPKKPSNDGEDESWMTTYADAITLLMCFFILLISVSEPNKGKMDEMKEGFMEAVKAEAQADPVEELQQEISQMIAENDLGEVMAVEETDAGMILEIASSSFYESGSADFKPLAIPILIDLTLILEAFDARDYVIEVEGHTDDVAMSGQGAIPTNWELSAMRATRVVRFFIEEGLNKEAMRARAYADTMPKVPNMDEFDNPIEENREINRRIAIRIERREE